MTLRERQSIFLLNVAKLIIWAYDNGYELTGGDLKSLPEYKAHSAHSLHYDRLAIDMNLFIKGKYQTETEAYKPLGEYWVSLHPDNNWGGEFMDGNHFSMSDGISGRK